MKKLAIFLPGIGYIADRPLLYFCRRIAANHGYEIKHRNVYVRLVGEQND